MYLRSGATEITQTVVHCGSAAAALRGEAPAKGENMKVRESNY